MDYENENYENEVELTQEAELGSENLETTEAAMFCPLCDTEFEEFDELDLDDELDLAEGRRLADAPDRISRVWEAVRPRSAADVGILAGAGALFAGHLLTRGVDRAFRNWSARVLGGDWGTRRERRERHTRGR